MEGLPENTTPLQTVSHQPEARNISRSIAQACSRWLSPDEVFEILSNYAKCGFTLNRIAQPRPRSGSIYLFDRSIVRYFKKDGYNWRKKDGRTVREAHQLVKTGPSEWELSHVTIKSEELYCEQPPIQASPSHSITGWHELLESSQRNQPVLKDQNLRGMGGGADGVDNQGFPFGSPIPFAKDILEPLSPRGLVREPETAIEASLQAATEERGLRAAAEPQQCQLGSTCSDSQNMDALLEGVEVAFSEVENLQVEAGPNYTFSTGKTLADLAEANGHGGIVGFLAKRNLMRALSSMIISKNPTGIAMAEFSRRESNSRSVNEEEDESSVVESLLADWNAARAGALINTAFQQCSVQKWEEDLLASIQVNEFGMTPHWYKEVTHTPPKYKGVTYMNELEKGSSDSEGGDANGGGHDIQMTQQVMIA
ncbi:unnamed protein product [Sphagnum balticum]